MLHMYISIFFLVAMASIYTYIYISRYPFWGLVGDTSDIVDVAVSIYCGADGRLPPLEERGNAVRGTGTKRFLLLVAMPGAPSSFLLLVVRPGAPSSEHCS